MYPYKKKAGRDVTIDGRGEGDVRTEGEIFWRKCNTHFGLLAYRTIREKNYVVLSHQVFGNLLQHS